MLPGGSESEVDDEEEHSKEVKHGIKNDDGPADHLGDGNIGGCETEFNPLDLSVETLSALHPTDFAVEDIFKVIIRYSI